MHQYHSVNTGLLAYQANFGEEGMGSPSVLQAIKKIVIKFRHLNSCFKNWFHLNRKYIFGILPKTLSHQAEYDLSIQTA